MTNIFLRSIIFFEKVRLLFTLVDLKSEKKSRFQHLADYFRKADIEFQKITLPSGESFYQCKSGLYRGKIPWKLITEKAPFKAFILPFDSEDESAPLQFEPKILPQKMLLNTAIDYMKKLNFSPSGTHLTIVDKKGLHLEKIPELIKLASLITVVTNKTEEYTLLSEKLFDSYGISLMLRRTYSETGRENSFLFDFDGEDIPLSYKGIAFSKEKKHLLNGKTMIPGGFELPTEYEGLWQKNTDKLQFASALYELCGVRELQNLRFNELCS